MKFITDFALKTKRYLKKEIRYYRTIIQCTLSFKKIVSSVIVFSLIATITDGIGIGLLVPFLQGFQSQEPFFLFDKLNISLNSKNEEMIVVLSIILILVVLKTLFTIIFQFFSNKLQLKVLNFLRESLISKIFSYKLAFFSKENCGRMVNVFMTQTMNYLAAVTELTKIFSNAFVLIVMYLIMLAAYFRLTMITSIFLGIILLMIQLLGRKIHYFQKLSLRAGENINALFMDDILGITLIKTFSMEETRLREHIHENNELYKSAIQHRMRSNSIQPLLEMIFILLIVGFLIYGMSIAKNNWISNLTYFLGFFILLERTRRSFNQFSTGLANLARYKQSVFNVDRIIKASDVEEDDGDIKIDKFKSHIVFKNISMSYDEGEIVLKDLNFAIKQGETVAIVGQSGSGKTTLINLLLKLYAPNRGEILVDGVNLKKIYNLSWYKKIGVVFQDSFIFNNTIAWNISRGDQSVDKKSIEEAGKIAAVEPFVSKLTDGYNSYVGDRGVKLSGGQRQRIAIARALVKNPDILIFDEATSSLDSLSEKLITEALEKIRVNRTMIVIAHRLSTVKNADKIVVLKKGEIVGCGKHDELLRTNEEYSLLYNTQFGL
ncbi:ABC transporter ATP-binding protein [Acidobacteriota bacterium]